MDELPPGAAATLLREPSKLFFQADNIRRSIIFAYWIVIILALPLWWFTTSIERLALPSTRVISQAQETLSIPVVLSLQTDSDDLLSAAQLKASITEHILRAPKRWEGIDIHVNHGQMLDNNKSVYSIKHSAEGCVLQDRQLDCPLQKSGLPQLIDLISDLVVPFAEQDHRVAQYAPRYRLSFTLLNEDATAGGSVNDWSVSGAISRHISPILTQLSILHNFTIESQVQFHAPLAFKPHILDNAYGLTQEDLTVFVNSAEWTLSSSASNDPVLHFVLFVPSASRRPLYIMDRQDIPSTSNAFLLPQWGGIVILNPPTQETSSIKLHPSSLDSIFSTFASHLLTLLGVPQLPLSLAKELPKSDDMLTGWQLDAVLRHRSLENARNSQETLRSIVKLVDQIENMPVRQDVKGDVQEALSAIKEMYISSRTSLVQTFRHSAHAFTLSSRAFFNPGMLALLYFPAEHKYAVYTPLFASAIIPLFVAAVREFLSWNKQRKQRSASIH